MKPPTQAHFFEGVSVCLLDVTEEGGRPLQGGDFVCIRLTKRHQRVQLVTVQTDPLPVQKQRRHPCIDKSIKC